MTTIPKTMLNVKVGVDLKKSAQAFAQEIGLPLATVVSNALLNTIESGKVVFSRPNLIPSSQLESTLAEANKNKDNKNYWNEPFNSVDDLMEDLQK